MRLISRIRKKVRGREDFLQRMFIRYQNKLVFQLLQEKKLELKKYAKENLETKNGLKRMQYPKEIGESKEFN